MEQKFAIDEKTLKDIQIKSINEKSIFDYFNSTHTEGGKEKLLDLFYSPSKNHNEIIARQIRFKRYANLLPLSFPFDRAITKDIHKYLLTPLSHNKSLLSPINIFRINTPDYYYTKRAILEVYQTLLNLRHFLAVLIKVDTDKKLHANYDKTQECIDRIKTSNRTAESEHLSINITNIDSLDSLIRGELREDILSLFVLIYDIDAGLSVIRSQGTFGLEFPTIKAKEESNIIQANGLFNLFHKNPVGNNIKITSQKRIWFLTGPNMAGKSSLIKSISIAVYLAHIGFPVPASSFTTNVLDGLFTSINLTDDSELGHSYFYAEVFRLKEIIDNLDKNSNALIILDELFKGTNEDDASDAILQIVKSFTLFAAPFVLITSHNINIHDKLTKYNLVDCFKLEIDRDSSGLPVFTYKVVAGIAKEKIGMYLIQKAGLIKAFENKY